MGWMAWTAPTAVFFACIGVMLVALTVLELYKPTIARRGWLPLVTTRGDRVFISLLSAAFVHLLGLAIMPEQLWVAHVVAAVWAVLVLRWG